MAATGEEMLATAPVEVLPAPERPFPVGLAVRYAVLIGTLLLTMFPLVWLVITSLRVPADIFAVPVHIIPESVTWRQYVNVFTQYNLAGYLWNTVIVSLVTVVFVTVLAIPCAYAMARFRLPGHRIVVSLLLIMRMIPVVALAIPLFAVFASLGLLDTLTSLILAHTAAKLPVAIWLLIGFVQDVPKEIEESAAMDGAGTLRILVQIVTPLIAPGARRERGHHVPLHLERSLDRADAGLERELPDIARRAHQFRLAIRRRLGRDVGSRGPDGDPDPDFRLVRARAPGEGARDWRRARLGGAR